MPSGAVSPQGELGGSPGNKPTRINPQRRPMSTEPNRRWPPRGFRDHGRLAIFAYTNIIVHNNSNGNGRRVDRHMRVAVVGGSGYAGGELLRLVSGHPGFELAVATADSSAGRSVADLHAHLAGHPALANLTFEPHSAVKEADADLVL